MYISPKDLKYNHKGFAVALAWPGTYCKQAGAWYDGLMRLLGFNRNYFYKAGHAASVLIDAETGHCYYFDFGRYHAPYAHGRVRSGDTDHDLEIKTKAIISEDGKKVLNFKEILTELVNNEACHGTGPLYGSYRKTNFARAYAKALKMQNDSPIIYGPFILGGTNCSRFVSTIVREGLPWSFSRLRVRTFVPVTPTPLNNVVNLGEVLMLHPDSSKEPELKTLSKQKINYA